MCSILAILFVCTKIIAVNAESLAYSVRVAKEITTEECTDVEEPVTEEDLSEDVSEKEETTDEDEKFYMLGDVNFDGKITAADARLALRASAQLETLTSEQLIVADVDGSGKITASDARDILRYSALLIDSFSVK